MQTCATMVQVFPPLSLVQDRKLVICARHRRHRRHRRHVHRRHVHRHHPIPRRHQKTRGNRRHQNTRPWQSRLRSCLPSNVPSKKGPRRFSQSNNRRRSQRSRSCLPAVRRPDNRNSYRGSLRIAVLPCGRNRKRMEPNESPWQRRAPPSLKLAVQCQPTPRDGYRPLMVS